MKYQLFPVYNREHAALTLDEQVTRELNDWVALDEEGGLHFGKTREAAAARVEARRAPIELLVV